MWSVPDLRIDRLPLREPQRLRFGELHVAHADNAKRVAQYTSARTWFKLGLNTVRVIARGHGQSISGTGFTCALPGAGRLFWLLACAPACAWPHADRQRESRRKQVIAEGDPGFLRTTACSHAGERTRLCPSPGPLQYLSAPTERRQAEFQFTCASNDAGRSFWTMVDVFMR